MTVPASDPDPEIPLFLRWIAFAVALFFILNRLFCAR